MFGGYLCQCYGVTKPETVDDLLDVHWTFCLTNTITGSFRTLARLEYIRQSNRQSNQEYNKGK